MAINRTNMEIEFKCLITEDEYKRLLTKFNLENNIKEQTNYYFDTLNEDLKNNKIVLRIRQKKDQYKLTSKVNQDIGLKESHVYLKPEEAINMIENGFDANVIGLDYFVFSNLSLRTLRVSTEYKEGKLFLDKSIYGNTTDYEIEYEVTDYDKGFEIFMDFLRENNITYNNPDSKFLRAYNEKKSID